MCGRTDRRWRACIGSQSFEASGALRMIGRERVTYLYVVPTLYHDMLAYPDSTDSDIRSVRKFGFAGAAMPERLLKRVNDLIITSGEKPGGRQRSPLSPDQNQGRRVTLLSSALERSTRTPSTPGAVLRSSPITSGRAPGSLSPISRNRRLARSCAASWSPGSTKQGVNSARRAAIDH